MKANVLIAYLWRFLVYEYKYLIIESVKISDKVMNYGFPYDHSKVVKPILLSVGFYPGSTVPLINGQILHTSSFKLIWIHLCWLWCSACRSTAPLGPTYFYCTLFEWHLHPCGLTGFPDRTEDFCCGCGVIFGHLIATSRWARTGAG